MSAHYCLARLLAFSHELCALTHLCEKVALVPPRTIFCQRRTRRRWNEQENRFLFPPGFSRESFLPNIFYWWVVNSSIVKPHQNRRRLCCLPGDLSFSFYPTSSVVSRRDLCTRIDLETALVSGHPAPFLMVTFLCAPRGCSWCQEGPPAGSSCGSPPKDHLTSFRAAEIRCEIE